MSLQRTATVYLRAREKEELARTELHSAIRAAIRAGVSQSEVCDVTGYSRETVRKIVKGA